MDRFDRIYHLHRLRPGRRVPISLEDLTTELECSEPTVKRTIRAMRDHLDVAGQQALERLLSGLSPGLLANELQPFRNRIESLLQRQKVGTGELYARLRILAMGARSVRPTQFRTITSALGTRKRLDLRNCSRSRDESTRRTVSPQRLVHYRDNWYLDGWCHMRKGLRIFAVDRIDTADMLDEAADDLQEADLDQRLARSYGIFSGVPRGRCHPAIQRRHGALGGGRALAPAAAGPMADRWTLRADDPIW